jgi:hypothetical protein
VQAPSRDRAGLFVWHRHIVEHEDEMSQRNSVLALTGKTVQLPRKGVRSTR